MALAAASFSIRMADGRRSIISMPPPHAPPCRSACACCRQMTEQSSSQARSRRVVQPGLAAQASELQAGHGWETSAPSRDSSISHSPMPLPQPLGLHTSPFGLSPQQPAKLCPFHLPLVRYHPPGAHPRPCPRPHHPLSPFSHLRLCASTPSASPCTLPLPGAAQRLPSRHPPSFASLHPCSNEQGPAPSTFEGYGPQPAPRATSAWRATSLRLTIFLGDISQA